MTNRQIIQTAVALKRPMVAVRAYSLQEDKGILMLNPQPAKGRYSHAVILVEGTILDPYNGRWWLDVETYCRVEGYRPGSLIVDTEE